MCNNLKYSKYGIQINHSRIRNEPAHKWIWTQLNMHISEAGRNEFRHNKSRPNESEHKN